MSQLDPPQSQSVPNQEVNPYSLDEDVIEIWDPRDPSSIVNMVPSEVAKKMKEAATKCPDLFELDEQQLADKLRTLKKSINATDNRIRLKFWMEYDEAKDAGRTMIISRIISGICTREFFYRLYLREPSRVAWLLCPPTNYMVKAYEALEFGLEQLRDILAIPHVDNKGRIDGKAAALKITIYKMLEDRIKGAVVQKVENKTVSLNFTNADKRLYLEQAESLTQDELYKRLANLRWREKKAMHLPDVETTEPQELIEAPPVEEEPSE